jgi:hypothetical protein
VSGGAGFVVELEGGVRVCCESARICEVSCACCIGFPSNVLPDAAAATVTG